MEVETIEISPGCRYVIIVKAPQNMYRRYGDQIAGAVRSWWEAGGQKFLVLGLDADSGVEITFERMDHAE